MRALDLDLDLDADPGDLGAGARSGVGFGGAVDVERADGVVRLHRLPAWARAQLVDPAISVLADMPAGIRLQLETDTTAFELDVELTLLRMGDAPTTPAAFDLVVDGEVVDERRSTDGTVIAVAADGAVSFHPGPPTTTIRFDELAPGTKAIEVWLPHTATMALHGVRIDDGATATKPTTDGRRRWVHYGSSISHCLEAPRPTGAWPAVSARAGGVELTSLAFAGQAQLDQFAARTIRDVPADLISLKVGINIVNADSLRERTFVPAVHGFLDTIRDGHPDTPLLVITPILCPAHEERPGPSVNHGSGFEAVDRPAELAVGALSLGRIRELLTQVVETRRNLGDAHLHLLDGRTLFGEDDVDDLPDGLHPNAAGYQRIGERFAATAFAAGGPFA